MVNGSIFIFGISSHLGANLANHLKDRYRVIGTYHENELAIPGTLSFQCDIRDKNQVKWLLNKFKPDYVFFCVGIPSMNFCERFPKIAEDITQQGLINVIAASESIGSKLYYFSTSFIFAGENIYYSESENPSPINTYGNIISNAEFFVQRTSFNYLIFRICNIFGRGPSFTSENWFEQVERNARTGETLYCDDHVFSGYLDINTFCKVIEKSLELNVSNRLFQLSSADICSRKDFAEKYEDITNSKIRKTVRDSVYPRFESYQNIKKLQFHLSIQNIEETFSLKLPTIEDSLKNFISSESAE